MRVTIDNPTLDRMLATPAIVALLPCLQSPPKAKGPQGCRACSRGSSNIDYNALKTCVALADSHTIQRLKQLLNASQMVVHRPTTRNGKPGTVRHTWG